VTERVFPLIDADVTAVIAQDVVASARPPVR